MGMYVNVGHVVSGPHCKSEPSHGTVMVRLERCIEDWEDREVRCEIGKGVKNEKPIDVRMKKYSVSRTGDGRYRESVSVV